jgi:hypothetical protein
MAAWNVSELTARYYTYTWRFQKGWISTTADPRHTRRNEARGAIA